MRLVLYILLVIIAIFIIWLIAVYNGLIASRHRLAEALSDIDV